MKDEVLQGENKHSFMKDMWRIKKNEVKIDHIFTGQTEWSITFVVVVVVLPQNHV